MPSPASRHRRFPELSYASPRHPRLKRWFIQSVEGFSGRDRFADLYDLWRREIAPTGDRVFGRMLALVDITLRISGNWPVLKLPDDPLVIVANHPFGIGDGIAVLSLAEALGRPFRVLIHKDLLKIPEMAPYALPISFEDTKEAMKANMAVRNEALALLKAGVTIVVFPAGGVATAPSGFGRAEDLPWKVFPARLVQEAKASVIPVFFSGQNGRLFHLVSKPMALAEREGRLARALGRLSLTMRLSLLIREFARLSGRTLDVRVGDAIEWCDLAEIRERKALIGHLNRSVFELAGAKPKRRRLPLSGLSRPKHRAPA
ncbi:MAG: 1-acyl-sn-glycerol-3-phosphate acyltransferase [Rhizobiaceae bacterium]|nr:1-acyl-sn-glycerol-3-phosphate acyltransferase [Rhizobiaceae bacterium]